MHVATYFRVKKLKFDANKEDLLNILLLRISGFAVLLYATLTIISAAFEIFLSSVIHAPDIPTLLVLVTAALTILEVSFQAPFVLDANKRAIHKAELNVTKPGRQFVTFLLLTNLAMFGIYIFEMQKVEKLPVQVMGTFSTPGQSDFWLKFLLVNTLKAMKPPILLMKHWDRFDSYLYNQTSFRYPLLLIQARSPWLFYSFLEAGLFQRCRIQQIFKFLRGKGEDYVKSKSISRFSKSVWWK